MFDYTILILHSKSGKYLLLCTSWYKKGRLLHNVKHTTVW